MDTVKIKIAKSDIRGGEITYTYHNNKYWFLANDVATALKRQNIYYLCGRAGWENAIDFKFGESTRKRKFISSEGITKLYKYWQPEDTALLHLVREISEEPVEVVRDTVLDKVNPESIIHLGDTRLERLQPGKPIKIKKYGKQRQIDNLHAVVLQHRKDLDFMFEELHNLRERVFAYIPKTGEDNK